MKSTLKILFYLTLFTFIISNSCLGQSTKQDTYNFTRKDFKEPPAEYSTAPFFVWNYIMTKPMIDEQLKLYKEIGINQFIIHPRPGLITEYLSKEWFDLIKYTIAKAKKLEMKVYLYDENSYPSGFAGGHVPNETPETMVKYIKMVTTTKPDTVSDKFIIFQKRGDEFRIVNNDDIKKDSLYYVFCLLSDQKNPWYAGFTYVDLLQKKTTLKFIETTHEKYKEAVGDEFGKTILGFFTDEPDLNLRQVPYTPQLFEDFQKRYDYDLKSKLPLLVFETGDFRKVRHDVYTLVLDLFVDNWAKPYSDWCTKNNIAMTGHYWEHDWGSPARVPDNMALVSYSKIPGIDLLMNNYSNTIGSQFGNDLMIRDTKSAANQMGKQRVLSETYGASGWDLTFQDMKRIGDYEYALGINLMNQHLTWSSITGYRKFDHPPSFSYHTPYIKDYKLLADYYSRLSACLTKGIQSNHILLLEPTTTTRMYWRYPDKSVVSNFADSIRMGCVDAFHKLTHEFETWQVEYDIASEFLIREYGTVNKNEFDINKGKYSLFILPPQTENLESKTCELLEVFLKNGGMVLSTNNLPEYVDGTLSNKVTNLAKTYPKNWITTEKITSAEINKLTQQGITFNVNSGENKLYHMRKELSDAQLVFAANIDDKLYSQGNFEIKGGSVEQWDIFTGEVNQYPFERNGESVKVGFNLPPGNSLLLCIRNEKKEPMKAPESKSTKIVFTDELKIERLKPNMLTIDYCDLRFEDKEYKDIYFYNALKKVFNAFGFEKNPWQGIQFKTQVIDKNYGANSCFEADYKFTVESGVNISSLQAVYERPEIFKLKINGNPIEAIKGKWFVDKGFAVYDISKFVKSGVNVITVISKPITSLSELDRLYILGDFALEPQEMGFKIVGSKPIGVGDWTKQGMQFYSDKVSYDHTPDIKELKGKYVVKLPDWKGTCAEVYVNDKSAGLIAIAPYELDITKYLRKGKNNIKVSVVSSLRNLLGPHHTKDAVGQTWPEHFFSLNEKQGLSLAGDSYVVVPYGLMKDFELINIQ